MPQQFDHLDKQTSNTLEMNVVSLKGSNDDEADDEWQATGGPVDANVLGDGGAAMRTQALGAATGEIAAEEDGRPLSNGPGNYNEEVKEEEMRTNDSERFEQADAEESQDRTAEGTFSSRLPVWKTKDINRRRGGVGQQASSRATGVRSTREGDGPSADVNPRDVEVHGPGAVAVQGTGPGGNFVDDRSSEVNTSVCAPEAGSFTQGATESSSPTGGDEPASVSIVSAILVDEEAQVQQYHEQFLADAVPAEVVSSSLTSLEALQSRRRICIVAAMLAGIVVAVSVVLGVILPSTKSSTQINDPATGKRCFRSGVELSVAALKYTESDDPTLLNVVDVYGFPIGSWCVDLDEDFSYNFSGTDINESLKDWNTSSAKR